jgi:hypothetical protein
LIAASHVKDYPCSVVIVLKKLVRLVVDFSVGIVAMLYTVQTNATAGPHTGRDSPENEFLAPTPGGVVVDSVSDAIALAAEQIKPSPAMVGARKTDYLIGGRADARSGRYGQADVFCRNRGSWANQNRGITALHCIRSKFCSSLPII